jgi:hypothetical protein
VPSATWAEVANFADLAWVEAHRDRICQCFLDPQEAKLSPEELDFVERAAPKWVALAEDLRGAMGGKTAVYCGCRGELQLPLILLLGLYLEAATGLPFGTRGSVHSVLGSAPAPQVDPTQPQILLLADPPEKDADLAQAVSAWAQGDGPGRAAQLPQLLGIPQIRGPTLDWFNALNGGSVAPDGRIVPAACRCGLILLDSMAYKALTLRNCTSVVSTVLLPPGVEDQLKGRGQRVCANLFTDVYPRWYIEAGEEAEGAAGVDAVLKLYYDAQRGGVERALLDVARGCAIGCEALRPANRWPVTEGRDVACFRPPSAQTTAQPEGSKSGDRARYRCTAWRYPPRPVVEGKLVPGSGGVHANPEAMRLDPGIPCHEIAGPEVQPHLATAFRHFDRLLSHKTAGQATKSAGEAPPHGQPEAARYHDMRSEKEVGDRKQQWPLEPHQRAPTWVEPSGRW